MSKAALATEPPARASGLEPGIDLAQLFGYRLWKLATIAGSPIIRLCEGRFDISRQEWSILSILARHGEMSPSDVATEIGLDRPRASKAVRALIGKGLMQRQRAREPGRRFLLQLTPNGLDLVRALYPQVRAVSDELLAGLEPAARECFESALAQLTEHAARLNRELFTDVKTHRRRGA